MATRRNAGLMRYLWVAIGLAACNEPAEDVDFGAAIIARYFADAERQCAAIDFDDIAACANATPRSKARLAARTANEALKTFNRNCAEDLGESRCNELLAIAYSRIQAETIAGLR